MHLRVNDAKLSYNSCSSILLTNRPHQVNKKRYQNHHNYCNPSLCFYQDYMEHKQGQTVDF